MNNGFICFHFIWSNLNENKGRNLNGQITFDVIF